MCGGSIISSTCILTAGHCLVPFLGDPSLRSGATVVAGTTYLNSGGQSYRISQYILHERYDRSARGRPAGYDIGLIKVYNLNIICIRITLYTILELSAWDGAYKRRKIYFDRFYSPVRFKIFSLPRLSSFPRPNSQLNFQRAIWYKVKVLR